MTMNEFPYANMPTKEDIEAYLAQQRQAMTDGRFLPQLISQPPGVALQDQQSRVEPVYEFRLWEPPEEGVLYGIGVDPSEGLLYGDDSVIEVGNCKTGHQVAEIQGKIHPFDLAELVHTVGTWYNDALVGIENNKDGGCNAKLLEMGYENVYFLAEDKGKGYQQAMPKVGINMSGKRRSELIAQARRWIQEERIYLVSEDLVAQMEVYALHNGKFQAPKGAHDDLVMGMLIMTEMMRCQVEMEEVMEFGVRNSNSEGELEVELWDEVEEESQVDRMLNNAMQKIDDDRQLELDSMENMV
jgi:hypothetical protein